MSKLTDLIQENRRLQRQVDYLAAETKRGEAAILRRRIAELEAVYAQWERAAERRAARLRNDPPPPRPIPPRPTPSPPAPILPPEPVTPAVPGLLGWIAALIVRR